MEKRKALKPDYDLQKPRGSGERDGGRTAGRRCASVLQSGEGKKVRALGM